MYPSEMIAKGWRFSTSIVISYAFTYFPTPFFLKYIQLSVHLQGSQQSHKFTGIFNLECQEQKMITKIDFPFSFGPPKQTAFTQLTIFESIILGQGKEM